MSETSPSPLQYRCDGPEEAPVLILGPSLGTTWHMWDRQVPELARQWRVVRFDLPGHGGAPGRPADTVGDLTNRLLATLDELGVRRFGYAGCALGGAIGVELALRHPERLASLALIAASPRFGTPDEFRQRGVVVRTNGLDPIARTAPDRWFTGGFVAAQPAITEWAVQMVRTTDPVCYVAACEALAAFDVRAELGRVRVPTLVLVGSEDQVTGPAEARTLVAGIPDARLAVVPGASHLVPVEQPAAVTDLLLRHFSSAWQAGHAAAPGHGGRPPAHAEPAPSETPPTPESAPASAPVVTAGSAPPVPGTPPEPSADESPTPPGARPPVGAERPAVPPQARADPQDAGLREGRETPGDTRANREPADEDGFSADFRELLTRYPWGEVLDRPGLDRRARICVTLTALAAGGYLEDLATHTRAALRSGFTPEEIREIVLQTAVYCGVPVAHRAFRVAQRAVEEAAAGD
ncbi:alpha/beta fold hydrolase [Streptomyces sp. WMMC905]|uniref:bifunctional 3-oxoadipate enol-lactonase/4-carboxymuconolactone decarboxylase PcaDC n=1 Tax=Streptomyces sp. WMMC905 TaxID=3404123 RepID=UPI003B9420A5